MKTKKPIIVAITAVFFPIIIFISYQIVKNMNADNFYLSLLGIACTLGAFILTIFSFIPKAKKL
ncbi:hypothetical protein DBR40_19080 [Pedobacter sp. KBW01]|uniref:hypothetical protein n=1 Tax=Pedobacter sp. KBW01 TaxID=2153364 RepID=UPI000F5A4C1E|nr:hypothetical protein [Pedobacter sp. KBW01]RQO69080.1 hypothetical protein DBR40_19080 [Pedobacter sp. KBW01]